VARQVDRAVEQLELGPLAARDPATLSGGELQRVIIAATLAMDSGLVLFDEPAAELDAEGARALWRLIRVLAQEGKAVLLATSALDALPDVADRVVWLEDGAVRAVGTPELLADVAACDPARERCGSATGIPVTASRSSWRGGSGRYSNTRTSSSSPAPSART